MDLMLLVHVAGGTLGLLSGFAALYAAKGGRLHRRGGMVFVYAMLTMCAGGLALAVVRGAAPAINIPAALLTGYLVVTALTTVREPATGKRWLEAGALATALAVGLACLTLGVEVVARAGTRNGMQAFPFFMFGAVALLGSAGDFRVMRTGKLTGARRIARHLWRMSFALFIAAMSFFIGQAKVIPEPFRIWPLLALPVLAVLVTMLYWLWRVRIRGNLRGTTVASGTRVDPPAVPTVPQVPGPIPAALTPP